MPIGSITLQPEADSLVAAYRPIVFQVSATATEGGTPPVVYCDIYINGIYYKSQLKTQPNGSVWQFDIQDAVQEVLKPMIPANGDTTVVPGTPSFATVQCYFRSSGLDVDGFITPEDTAPIQGTGTVAPTAGTGTASNSFFAVNATLQHDQNQDFEAHLSAYKQLTWDAEFFPLTHRGNLNDGAIYRVCGNGSDYFPIVTNGATTPNCVQILYTLKDGTTGSESNCGAGPSSCPVVGSIGVETEDNGNGTQTFTFHWGTPDPLLTSIAIQYRVDGSGGAYTSLVGSTASGRTVTLPVGVYEFRLQMNGACTSSFSSTFSDGVEAPICVAPSVSGDLPDAITSSPYSYNVPVTGTAPFSLSSIVKPAWMSVNVVGSNVALTGTPSVSDEGTGIPVSFTVTNDCGSDSFSDDMRVLVLEKTLTFTATAGLVPQIVAQFDTPVDVDVLIGAVFVDGYTTSDCTGGASVGMSGGGFNIPAGTYANSASGSPSTGWTTVHSFTIVGANITVSGGYAGPVFPGDVITMGSYTVTIVFDGC